MDSFCNVFLKKNFIKCISKKENLCYLFVGKIPFIKKILNSIKRNLKNKEKDVFNGISDTSIHNLYQYLNPHDKENDDIEDQKEDISSKMFLNEFPPDK